MQCSLHPRHPLLGRASGLLLGTQCLLHRHSLYLCRASRLLFLFQARLGRMEVVIDFVGGGEWLSRP